MKKKHLGEHGYFVTNLSTKLTINRKHITDERQICNELNNVLIYLYKVTLNICKRSSTQHFSSGLKSTTLLSSTSDRPRQEHNATMNLFLYAIVFML